MATVTGLTKERMLAMEAETVTSGLVDVNGNLLLTSRNGVQMDAGSVMPGLNILLPAVRDYLYPVGCVYLSVNGANPATLFGGVWALWGAGRVPVGVDTSQIGFDTVEEIGGVNTVTLTAAESGLRAHNHTQNAHNHTQDAHNHTQNAHNHTQNAHAHSSSTMVPYINTGSTYGHTVGGSWVFGSVGNPAISSTTATNIATTPTNVAATAANQSTTATNVAIEASNAVSAHTNLQPYITCYMWKRTA